MCALSVRTAQFHGLRMSKLRSQLPGKCLAFIGISLRPRRRAGLHRPETLNAQANHRRPEVVDRRACSRRSPTLSSQLAKAEGRRQDGVELMAGRRETALPVSMHEAGHARVALVVRPGKYINAMWIKESPDGWGGMVENGTASWRSDICGQSGDPEPYFQSLARSDCISYLAGPVAEARWMYRTRFAVRFVGRQISATIGDRVFNELSDLARVQRRLEWLDPATMTASFVELWDETEALIAKHWRQTLELGRLLAERKRLEDVEIYTWWEGQRQ